jgi:hypothetical protein
MKIWIDIFQVKVLNLIKKEQQKHSLMLNNLDMETLKIKSIVRDSSFFKYIISKPDGYIYHAKTNSLLGRNVSDVLNT